MASASISRFSLRSLDLTMAVGAVLRREGASLAAALDGFFSSSCARCSRP